jgi:glycosyltransferase involved in cell wall biosynthesis
MFTKKTSLIIPTFNRQSFLSKILSQINFLKINFKEIIIIDSSDSKNKKLISNICKIYSVKLYNSLPSASKQRNIGLKKVNKNSEFVMFLDDDISFFSDSFIKMNNFLLKNKNNFNGFGFNLIQKRKKNFLDKIKNTKFINYLNLYSRKPGIITKSGWHTRISNLKNNTKVDWIYTAASIYKLNTVKNIRFSNSFGRYSYLEDLDYSLKIKDRKFVIVSSARFKHPNDIIRNNYNFGIIEIFNRFLIVHRYKLSKKSFFLGAILRTMISFSGFFEGKSKSIFRTFGNIIGILKSLLRLLSH